MTHPIAVISAALALSVVATLVVAAQPPAVMAAGEALTGSWSEVVPDVAVFKGIPFAAPPVGDRRWRAPNPPIPRSGSQSATTFAPACPQGEHLIRWYAGVAQAFGHDGSVVARPNGISEDCLYLNVWTPSMDRAATRPVIVWFHGGSNKSGWSYEPNYLGDRLASRGVVVVTLTYRLGPLGFFAHPAMQTGAEKPLANFGYLDSVAGLVWVNEHIAAFGGDPDNVTVMGESSGAGDLANLTGAEVAAGLYRRAIAQSPGGNLESLPTFATEASKGEKVAAQLGIPNDDRAMARLRAIDPMTIIEAAEVALPGNYYDIVIDDVSVTGSMIDRLRRKGRPNVDFLIGTNADEWYMYLGEDTTDADVDAWLAKHAPAHAAVLRAQVADAPHPRRALDRLVTARDMLCPARRAAAQVSTLGGRAWMYFFTRQRPGAGGADFGAYHGAEIPYVFDTHDAWLPTDADDRRLTEIIMDYWVQFARTGDPNIAGRPPWPPYVAAKPMVMTLGDEVGAAPPRDAALCLWLTP